MNEIKIISIDIEIYSDIDLSKCGVYKYYESENFEILLFGYSINHGEVQVVDLAMGEKIYWFTIHMRQKSIKKELLMIKYNRKPNKGVLMKNISPKIEYKKSVIKLAKKRVYVCQTYKQRI